MADLLRIAGRTAGALFGGCSGLLAQCSMCRTAITQNSQAAKTFNLAIVILLMPALFLFTGVFLWSMRRRNSRDNGVPGSRPR
jgi:hypothetical protein